MKNLFIFVILFSSQFASAQPADRMAEVEELQPQAETISVSPGSDSPRSSRGTNAPIWAPLQAALKACDASCVPAMFVTWRLGGNPESCATQGKSISIGSLRCGSKVYSALNGGKFLQVMKCVRDKQSKLKVFHRGVGGIGQMAYPDIAYISMGCNLPGRPARW